jgi:hypothetical protein
VQEKEDENRREEDNRHCQPTSCSFPVLRLDPSRARARSFIFPSALSFFRSLIVSAHTALLSYTTLSGQLHSLLLPPSRLFIGLPAVPHPMLNYRLLRHTKTGRDCLTLDATNSRHTRHHYALVEHYRVPDLLFLFVWTKLIHYYLPQSSVLPSLAFTRVRSAVSGSSLRVSPPHSLRLPSALPGGSLLPSSMLARCWHASMPPTSTARYCLTLVHDHNHHGKTVPHSPHKLHKDFATSEFQTKSPRRPCRPSRIPALFPQQQFSHPVSLHPTTSIPRRAIPCALCFSETLRRPPYRLPSQDRVRSV